MIKQFKILFFLGSFAFCITSFSQIKLPRLISDGMILQRDQPVKLWGWASENEEIAVLFNEKRFTARTGNDRKWHILLPPQKAGGPYTMRLNGKNEITINDILIGDVWLCSGQSNMELWMGRLKYKYPDEMNASNNQIRQFLVPDKYDFLSPGEDLDSGTWLSADPKNITGFSAVAYFFAKDIYAKYKIPIGLINAALGGSPAEAWISEDALKKFPVYYDEAKKFRNIDLITGIEKKDRAVSNAWYQQLNETDTGIKKNWRSPSVNDADWQQMNIPGYWADTEAGFFNGAVWFRKEFHVHPGMAGKPAKLELGRIVDADSVFINGQYVGNTAYQYPPRRYELAPGILKKGKNNITIRVINNSGKGGFVSDKRYEITTAADTIDLKGSWKYRTGAVMNSLPGQTFIRWKPLGLYNAMIAPLINYSIRGVIWYQGEANTKNPAEYESLMKALIEDWRKAWKKKDLPFLFVQLANFMESKPIPSESNWAATRQAQLNTLSMPHTGMAVTIDLGEWNDIHPENKKDVGQRLALLARKIAYQENTITASGPLYKSMKTDGHKIILNFKNTGDGLVAKGTEGLKHFAIAGADKKYVWAKAVINGNTVIVWNDKVKKPISVRYAWADNPEGANLYNKNGLPASPFSTDQLPTK